MKRTMKLLSVLAACLLLMTLAASAAFSDVSYSFPSGMLDQAAPTMEELYPLYLLYTQTASTEGYTVEPSVTAPYATGAVSQAVLMQTLNAVNFMRACARLPAVELNEEKNQQAQYGAVLLAATNSLTHYPTQPADMDAAFFEQGAAATASSNIGSYWGSVDSLSSVLRNHISECMRDSSNSNMSSVGHRRWLLNPALQYVGFGAAKSTSNKMYTATKVFDESAAVGDYTFIAWPPSGIAPTQLFEKDVPWSVTLNPAKFKTPVMEDITVTITCVASGKVWTRNASTYTDDPKWQLEYFNVDNKGYGIDNCIIFNIGYNNFGTSTISGDYTVAITGLQDKTSKAVALYYTVKFVDFSAYSPLPKSYSVTFGGSASVDLVGEGTASSGSDYHFSVNAAEGYDYGTPLVTIGGAAYTSFATDENGYTIHGNDIAGDIVITLERTLHQEQDELLGDANGNKTVNSADAAMILRYTVKLEDLSEQALLNADVNLDKKVTAADAAAILRYTVKLDTLPPTV